MSRFDILGSSFYDSKPRYSVPPCLTDALELDNLHPSLQSVINRLQESPENLEEVGRALEAAAHLSAFVNRNAHDAGFCRDAARAAKAIAPVNHMLLSLPRWQGKEIHPRFLLTEMIRLTLLILTAELKLAFSFISDERRWLYTRFSELLLLASRIDPRFSDVTLWACVLVTTLSAKKEQRSLHMNTICRCMRNLGITKGQDAVELARNLVWVEKLSDTGTASLVYDIGRSYCFLETDYGSSLFSEPKSDGEQFEAGEVT